MEMVMQYVWQTGAWGRGPIATVDGRRVDVVDRGTLNTGSGPDFFNAKVRIDGQLWIGNIEIHVRASDWYRHGHDSDTAYANVILHVVAVDDCEVTLPGTSAVIPQVLMRDAPRYKDFYDRLANRELPAVGCASRLPQLSALEREEWLANLGYARLQRKADDIAALVEKSAGDWSQTAFVILARGLGFGTNADAMERMARSLPLKILAKHADKRLALEAMLMGQAGLIQTDTPADDYHARLTDEYRFMVKKFNLEAPMGPEAWHFGAIRPDNTPWRRIALLAACVAEGVAGGSRLFELSSTDQALALFDLDISPYWQSHSRPGVEATSSRRLSVASRNLLIINVILPLIYARAEAIGRYDRTAVCPDILQSLPAEDNRIVRLFSQAGITARDALASQAIIELYTSYCTQRRCLSCRFAHRLLAHTISAGR